MASNGTALDRVQFDLEENKSAAARAITCGGTAKAGLAAQRSFQKLRPKAFEGFGAVSLKKPDLWLAVSLCLNVH